MGILINGREIARSIAIRRGNLNNIINQIVIVLLNTFIQTTSPTSQSLVQIIQFFRLDFQTLSRISLVPFLEIAQKIRVKLNQITVNNVHILLYVKIKLHRISI